MFKPVFVLVAAFLVFHCPALAQDCLKLGVQEREELVVVGHRISRVLNELGVCSELVVLPQARLPSSLADGSIDGEILRDVAYSDIVGEVAFRVPEPVVEAEAVIVTRNMEITGISDLKGKSVGVVRGTSWVPIYSPKFGKLYEVNSADQLLDMLGLDRIDAILTNSYSWNKFKASFGEVKVVPFRDLSVFIWLTKDNRDWSEKVAAAIKSYRSSGGDFLVE